MTFQESLDQSIDWLQREGHVTYRTLMQIFGLDQALLSRIIHERSWRGRQMCVRSGRTQQ